MLKSTLLFAALIAALTTSFTAFAADEKSVTEDKPAAAKVGKKAEATKKVRPHQHPADAKGGTLVEPTEQSEGEVKKPLHQHQKFHK